MADFADSPKAKRQRPMADEDGIKDESGDDSSRLRRLEATVDSIAKAVIRQPEDSTFSIEYLHNKVDKLIRVVADVQEAQAKLVKLVQTIAKTQKSLLPPLPPNSVAAAIERIQNPDVDSNTRLPEERHSKPPENQNTDPFIWGQNLLLVGDQLWQSFFKVDDLKVIIDQMMTELNFRINSRENEQICRIYDVKRDKVLFSMPPNTTTVVISIGMYDLLKDSRLKTLRDASLVEVRQSNKPILKEMADSLVGLAKKLLHVDKQVILAIPAYGTKMNEVFRQWEEVIIDATKHLTFPSFRILNLPDVVRSTLPHQASAEAHLNKWFSSTSRGTSLSSYGTRRLFDELRRVVSASQHPSRSAIPKGSQQSVGKLSGSKVNLCPRCTRAHAGNADSCKSIDKMCHKCGSIGHYVQVHQVTDPQFQREIQAVLGDGILFDSSSPSSGGDGLQNVSVPAASV